VFGLCLDRHFVDDGRDLVAVLGGGDHGNVRLGQQFHDLRVGHDVAGEDDAGNDLFVRNAGRSDGGKNDVVAVAGGDDEDAGLEVINHAARGHGPNHKPVNPLVDPLGFAVDPAPVHFLDHLGEVGGAEHLLNRENTEQRDAEAL